MPFSRLLFSAAKHRLQTRSTILRRFDQCKRIQTCNYSKSTRPGYEKPGARPALTGEIETETPRSWGVYAAPGLLLGFVGLATFLHYNDEKRAVPKGGLGKDCSCDKAQAPIIGGPFTLVDTENRVVTEKSLIGNWVLLYFGYTSSPDIGPEQLKMMAKTIDTLESKQNIKILPVFVTIDPQLDTPAHLRTYLREFDSRIVGLTGPVTAVRQMAQEYRVFFRKVEEEGDDYLVESSHNMYLMNPGMEVVRCFGIEYTPEALAKDIQNELQRIST